MDIRKLEQLLIAIRDNLTTFKIYRKQETDYPEAGESVSNSPAAEEALTQICLKYPVLDVLCPIANPFTDEYEIHTPSKFSYAKLYELPATVVKIFLSYHPVLVTCLIASIQATYGRGEPKGPAKREKRVEVTDWLQYYEVIDATEADKMNFSKKWTAEQFRIAKEWFHPYQIASHFENMSRLLKVEPLATKIMLEHRPEKADRACKLPMVSESYLQQKLLSRNPPKDCKEINVAPYGKTNQFDDEKPWESCFPNHNPRDYATLLESVRRRLRFIKQRDNELNYNRPITLMLGQSLFNCFVDYYEIPQLNFCDVLWSQCIDENYNNRLNKSFTTLLNKLDVCDPDFNIHEAGLFLKSQGLTKIGRLYKGAKAGQMIIELKEMVILIMGVAVRYIGKVIDEYLVKQKTLINYRLNPTAMFKFVRDNWNFKKKSTSNDYTLFDTNQGVEFVRFQVALMQHIGIPEFIIDFYEDYKLHIITKYGYLQCMTLSGEPPTFLFNSYDNIAYSLLKYDIKKGTAALIGGDDGTFNDLLVERNNFAKVGRYFTLTAVSEYGYNPTFCGWHFTADGPYKDPLLLVHRLYRANEMHNLDNVIDSYSDEAKYAYAMGDSLLEHMSEDDIECQSFLNHFFTVNAHKLHTASAYRMSDEELKSLTQNL